METLLIFLPVISIGAYAHDWNFLLHSLEGSIVLGEKGSNMIASIVCYKICIEFVRIDGHCGSFALDLFFFFLPSKSCTFN